MTDIDADKEGCVNVRWDCGGDNDYRMGYNGKYDLQVSDESEVREREAGNV